MSTALVPTQPTPSPAAVQSIVEILAIRDREELLREIEWLAQSAELGRNLVIAELLRIIVDVARGARAVDLLDLIGDLRRFDIESRRFL